MSRTTRSGSARWALSHAAETSGPGGSAEPWAAAGAGAMAVTARKARAATRARNRETGVDMEVTGPGLPEGSSIKYAKNRIYYLGVQYSRLKKETSSPKAWTWVRCIHSPGGAKHGRHRP